MKLYYSSHVHTWMLERVIYVLSKECEMYIIYNMNIIRQHPASCKALLDHYKHVLICYLFPLMHSYKIQIFFSKHLFTWSTFIQIQFKKI